METESNLKPLLIVRDAARALDFYVKALSAKEIVFAVQEFCGERMARVRDPFGHLWLLSQLVEELSTEEKQKRRDTLFAELASMAEAPAGLSGTPKNE